MPRRVVITGAAGQLGSQLVRAFSEAGDEVLALRRSDFDITRAADLARLTAWRPDVVVNAAAWTDVDGCARDPERAMRINGKAAGAVAEAAARADALIVQISTNEVFEGTLDRPYTEDDEPNPVNPYGVSKLASERLVAAANPRHLVVRTAWLFGPGGSNFVTKIRAAAERAAAAGEPLRVVDDEWGNPTPVAWLAAAIRQLIEMVLSAEAKSGAYHLAGWPPTTRYEWARRIMASLGGPEPLPIQASAFSRASRVPPRAVLDLSKAASIGISPAAWDITLGKAAAER